MARQCLVYSLGFRVCLQAHVDLTADEPDSALGDEPHQLHTHVARMQLHYVQLALCDLC